MKDARSFTETLGGRWHDLYGTAPCPVCQPQARKDQNALTLSDGLDGRLLLHCKKANCSFRNILAAAGVVSGHFAPPVAKCLLARETECRVEAEKKSHQARRLWEQSVPIAGTVAETYLREARGITCSLPPTLRFHPACWHTSGQYMPALIALVEGGKGFAVHRTYLHADSSTKARVMPNKMMLGGIAGGAVRLTEAQGPLVVAEGIETSLSLSCGLLSSLSNVWAALSTSGLRSLYLPNAPGQLIVAPDGDPAGRSAANDLAASAHKLGWNVSLLPAPNGLDWNDILQKKGDTV